ncbi:MAG: hypothetical protein WB053_11240 [Nitrososphaeraceae archaeon]
MQWNKALPTPRIDTAGMKEVRELERLNLHNQMWTFANSGEPSGLADIFKGQSPFDDGGDLEVIEGILRVQTYHSCQMRPKNSLLD